MYTIYKYELKTVDLQDIEMVKGAEILFVAGQEVTKRGPDYFMHADLPMIWARVDRTAPTVKRRIAIIGTGNPAPVPGDGIYVGTAICGPLVWHVFDGGEV